MFGMMNGIFIETPKNKTIKEKFSVLQTELLRLLFELKQL